MAVGPVDPGRKIASGAPVNIDRIILPDHSDLRAAIRSSLISRSSPRATVQDDSQINVGRKLLLTVWLLHPSMIQPPAEPSIEMVP